MASEVEALVRHLRQNPQDLRRPAGELAQNFGLKETLVADVLRWLDGSATPVANTKQSKSVAKTKQERNFIASALYFFDSRALPIVIISSVAANVVHLVTSLIPTTIVSRVPINFVNYGVALVALAFQTMSFFARGRLKFAGIGALIVALIESVGGFIDVNPGITFHPIGILKGVLLGVFVLMLGLTASVLGGVQKYRAEEKRRANLTRQQMLERLFEVRERVAAVGDASSVIGSLPQWRRNLQRDIWWYSFGLAACLGLVTIVLGLIFDPSGMALQKSNRGEFSSIAFMLFFVAIFNFVVWSLLGFFSGSPGRALTAASGAILGGLLAGLLPIGPYGMQALINAGLQQWITSTLILIGIFTVGGAAALVEQHQRKLDLHAKNDTSVLLAEMLELEWKLRPQSHRVCVMVVDASKSSIMKAHADPFEAEWSFREYQTFLARISGQHLGSVHAIAGDGAVVGFPSSSEAYSAAKQIQAEIGEFNQLVNRLSHPFNLRIGLHAGEIQGALDQVMYTEVIDIAAHVEAACPLGGIAVTEPVAQELGVAQFIDLAQKVDGYAVFAWQPAKFEV